MDLRFTDEQEMLRQTVRELCEKHASPEIVRALEDDPTGYREEFWKELVSLGLTGLLISEQHGGVGATPLDLAIVYEEFGRALAPSPHFVSSVVAAGLLRALGRTDLLPAIASSDEIVTVALIGKTQNSGDSLSGEMTLVPFASSATQLLAVVGDSLYFVDPVFATLTQEKTMGSDSSYRVSFASAPAERLGDARPAMDEAMTDAWIALAAYANGGAARAHEMAVAYAKERVQFNKPIGAFQGVAHPLADTATEIEGSKIMTYRAAWLREQADASAITAAAMAKLYAADVFKRTTKVGQQVLGGIGFTRDIDMQLYFRRAKQLEITWFGPRELEARIAAAELDTQSPFVSIATGAAP